MLCGDPVDIADHLDDLAAVDVIEMPQRQADGVIRGQGAVRVALDNSRLPPPRSATMPST